MITNFRFRLICLIFTALFFSACATSHRVTEKIEGGESRGIAILVTPTPFFGQIAKVRGENRAIKIGSDLKESLEQQELPDIWLEFDLENGKVLKTELDNKFDEDLKSAGKSLFWYQYVIHHSANPDERWNASYNQSMAFVNALDEMRTLEIDSPDGKRKLTENEIKEILHKQAGLINDRYKDLDEHF